jgi:hypothetical protein
MAAPFASLQRAAYKGNSRKMSSVSLVQERSWIRGWRTSPSKIVSLQQGQSAIDCGMKPVLALAACKASDIAEPKGKVDCSRHTRCLAWSEGNQVVLRPP